MLIDRYFSAAQLDAILFSKKDTLGRPIYFPNGALGPGYIVQTDEQKIRILKGYIFRADVFIAAVIFICVTFVILDLPLAFYGLAAIVAFTFYLISSQRNTKGLEKTPEKLTRREANQVVAQLTSWQMLILMEVFFVLLFCLHLFLLFQSWAWEHFAFAVCSGIGALVWGYQLLLKIKSN